MASAAASSNPGGPRDYNWDYDYNNCDNYIPPSPTLLAIRICHAEGAGEGGGVFGIFDPILPRITAEEYPRRRRSSSSRCGYSVFFVDIAIVSVGSISSIVFVISVSA